MVEKIEFPWQFESKNTMEKWEETALAIIIQEKRRKMDRTFLFIFIFFIMMQNVRMFIPGTTQCIDLYIFFNDVKGSK